MRGCAKLCFMPRAVSVEPAVAEKSPAERVVGTQTCGGAGAFFSGMNPRARPNTLINGSSCASSSTPFARHIRTILPASVTEPPPSVTTRSASAARAARVAATTSRRGVCGAMRSQRPASATPERDRRRSSRSAQSVSREMVPPSMRNTRLAPARSASAATASSNAAPIWTRSMAG